MTDSNSNDKNLNCSFCGKNKNAVKKLVAGPTSFICNECISISYKIINDEDHEYFETDGYSIPSPSEIKKFLDTVVISQHDAKEILSVCAYNHYKKMFIDETDQQIEKSNIILIGSTGSGKTLLAQTLAKKLDVPFAIADATTLTEAGYVGEDVESLIERLLNACDWKIEKAQRGIVFIDEIDKKARSSESNTGTKDISGEGVQQALLRLIEGTIIKVPTNGSKRMDQFIEFDTSNVLFICSGAFVGLDKTIKARTNKKNIGFNTEISKNEDFKWQQYVEHRDLISYGLIPEFVGRLPNIVTLEDLTIKDMISILSESKVSVLLQVKKLLEFDNIDLQFSDKYVEDVAQLASKRKTGARGLKSIVETSLHNIMFRAPDLCNAGVRKVIFNQYPDISVDNNPVLVFDDGREQVDNDYKIILRGQN